MGTGKGLSRVGQAPRILASRRKGSVLNRRHFLQSFAGLALCPSVSPFSPSVKSTIRKFGRSYLIEVDRLRCSLVRCRKGASLTFGVFVTRQIPGMVEENIMLPTEKLKSRLEEAGFPVVWGNSDYPFAICDLDRFPSPHDVASRLQRVLVGCDSRELGTGLPLWIRRRLDLDDSVFEVR